jgi:hypothetical protein
MIFYAINPSRLVCVRGRECSTNTSLAPLDTDGRVVESGGVSKSAAQLGQENNLTLLASIFELSQRRGLEGTNRGDASSYLAAALLARLQSHREQEHSAR